MKEQEHYTYSRRRTMLQQGWTRKRDAGPSASGLPENGTIREEPCRVFASAEIREKARMEICGWRGWGKRSEWRVEGEIMHRRTEN
jgi:hypothetical protein